MLKIIRKYDALNSKMSYEELKILLLNEDASETEEKKRNSEGKPTAKNANNKTGKRKMLEKYVEKKN